MSRTVLVLNGHPDPVHRGLCQALADAYAEGAREAGHAVRQLEIATLDFALLRSQAAFENEPPPPAIASAQEQILWAQHLVMVFPLWLGDMPALLKGFLEQTLRPGFAFSYRPRGFPLMHLAGRSARVVVTMGMPALVYRWYYRAHGVKNLERNILGFVGYRPVRDTIVGSVATRGPDSIRATLEDMKALGRRAA